MESTKAAKENLKPTKFFDIFPFVIFRTHCVFFAEKKLNRP